VEIPLPWERVLWSGRPAFSLFCRERYVLSDFRLVRTTDGDVRELLLSDIGEIQRTQSRLERMTGTSTLNVFMRGPRGRSLVLRRVRHGQQLAALLEWLSNERGERRLRMDAIAVAAAMAWTPQSTSHAYAAALVAMTATLVVLFGIVVALRGRAAPALVYGPDDSIYPNGQKLSRAAVVRYMERDVMPWARATLGPLKGGADRISCATCHGRDPEVREWRMPAVAALPQPDIRERGWERSGGRMDAQMRNAIYGYLAESDKQTRAAYMREVVMPGMADLLHRPAYDFTKPYEYNRARLAFGCYHCHRVN
jgi:cytochrome c553